MGNLTRNPELRYTPSNLAVVELGLAVTERVKDSTTSEWKEKPVYVDVTVWGQQAERCAKVLTKGSPIVLEGRLTFEQWETRKGEPRSKLSVIASRVQFLGGMGAHPAGTEYTGEQTNGPQSEADKKKLPF